MSASVALVLWRRSLNEVLRVRGALLPATIAPVVFLLGMSGQFGRLTGLEGFPTDSYMSWIVPLSCLQGAGFAGAATGANLARDIEQGWFDRLLVSPVPRRTLFGAAVLSAGVRALLPVGALLIVGLAVGANFPGLDGLALALIFPVLFSAVTAGWSVTLALRFRTQSAAPLMQAGNFIAVLFTASYAPMALLTPWLRAIATYNPVNYVVQGTRQGFVGDVTWAATWPAVVALVGLIALFFALALRSLRRFES